MPYSFLPSDGSPRSSCHSFFLLLHRELWKRRRRRRRRRGRKGISRSVTSSSSSSSSSSLPPIPLLHGCFGSGFGHWGERTQLWSKNGGKFSESWQWLTLSLSEFRTHDLLSHLRKKSYFYHILLLIDWFIYLFIWVFYFTSTSVFYFYFTT